MKLMLMQKEVLGYIEVPHRKKPCWIYPDYPDNFPPVDEDGDDFYKGDHDNHSTLEIESIERLESIAYNYDGRQWVNVRTLAKEMLEELT